jgi:glutamate racemase
MKVLAFDSGVGGLTAMAPLFRHELKEGRPLDLSYFGDLANLPYGTKSPERIRELTERNLRALLSKGSGFDLLVVACHTASAHALDVAQKVGQEHKVPVVGVLEPGCRAALEKRGDRIVVIATGSTVRSGAYPRALLELGFKGQVLQKACPLFVPLVEDGMHSGPAVEWIIRHYLDSIVQPGDIVILGCTHYPFLAPMLRQIYRDCHFVEAGDALRKDPLVQKACGKKAGRPTLRLCFSDASTNELQARTLVQQLDFGAPLGDAPASIALSYEITTLLD